MSDQKFDLDTILMDLSSDSYTARWTIRDAVEGVQIFGGIGSGKTSGSGRTLALKYLRNNFGGLVLTAKHDEKELWETYCREAGREQDLIIVEPGSKNHFNFLEYESASTSSQKSLTMNIVQVLKTVIKASQDKSRAGTDDNFWEGALDMLLANTIDLCLQAYGKVTVQQLYDIAKAAPKREPPVPAKQQLTPEQEAEQKKKQEAEEEAKKNDPFRIAFNLAMAKVKKQVLAWKLRHTKEQLARYKNNTDFTRAAAEALPDVRTMSFVNYFFTGTYRSIADKTRSIIDFTLMGFLYNLLREPVYSLFCRYPSNFLPEDCLKGKIILLHLPVKDYHKIGKDAQILFKYIWQRAMERRRIRENGRPVFLWADEAQHFLHEHDAEYQATARSSRIATVYISQNLPNYFANMGGKEGEYRVKSFLGTLGTKIFHANADVDTNTYASQLIGQGYTKDTQNSATMAGEFSNTKAVSYKLEYIMRPEHFVGLKTGGPLHQKRVEGIIHTQGKQIRPDANHSKLLFKQM
jgi:type IV secretory pathway TraG/TraD family ATPase VirD4